MNALRGCGATRTLALAFAVSVVGCPFVAPAWANTSHPAVTVRGADVEFYAGHLVLDAKGGASLDDGVLHVTADRIVVDLNHNRYVAAGDVRVTGAARGSALAGAGAALGVDLSSHDGTLVAIAPTPSTYTVTGPLVEPAPVSGTGASPTPNPAETPFAAATPTPEPLALVDLEGEQPFATAAVATAHLGADVRLGAARVIVPGGRDVYLPSYVYTFASEVGYSQSNVSGSSEDIPIYFGSTRDSITGAHFTYSAATKVGIGLDHRIIDGGKAYDLFSVSPLYGDARDAEFTWYEQVNGHASQTIDGRAADGVGSVWTYGAIDSLHRSYLSLAASDSLLGDFETVTWQGAYEPLGTGWAGELFDFHLATSYGRSQPYAGGAAPVYDTSFDALVQAPALVLDPSSSLSLSADWSETFDDQPHRRFAAAYTATMTHRWDPFLTTRLSDTESPTVDVYPSFGDGTREYVSGQVATIAYQNGEPFAFTFGIAHAAALSAPPGISVQPWSASLDVRFRVSGSLAFDVSRSYGFGYLGQRFGGFGFQILP